MSTEHQIEAVTLIRNLVGCCRLLLQTVEDMVGESGPAPSEQPLTPPSPAMLGRRISVTRGVTASGVVDPAESPKKSHAKPGDDDQWIKLASFRHKCRACGVEIHPRFKPKHICLGQEVPHRPLPMQSHEAPTGAPALEPAERSSPAVGIKVAAVKGKARPRLKGGLD